MALEIYSYGNVDALHGIFNAVAMIFGGSDYQDMVRVCVVAGFLVVGVFAALPGQSWKGWSWLISVTMIYSVLFIPRVDVLITDKLGTQAPVTVGNVPWALAMFASVKSVIGQTLTGMFETGFQTIPSASRALPSELSYQEHGLMFGSRLIKASRSANIIDPQLRSDSINYVRNCVVPELGHNIDPKTLQQSSSVWAAMATTNKALFTNYMKGSAYVVSPCDTAYSDLTALMPTAVEEVRKQIASSLFPDLSAAAAAAKINPSLEAAYTKTALAGASSSASDILLQNMAINLFADTQQVISVATADPASVMLAATRANATAQMNMSYTTQGRIAEEALPIVRNVTEAILFAVFPVVVLLLVASEGQALGRILKAYIYALLWVELWPVMFAVLNFIATTYSARNIAAMAYTSAGTALSMDNAGPIYTTTLSDVSVVGYMVTMVPALAAALLFGMDKIVSAVPGQGIGSAADREAGQTSKGNLGYGNMQFENQSLAPNQTDAFMKQQVGVTGTTTRDVLTGEARFTYNQGTNPLSIRDTQQISQAASTEQGKALERADGLSKQASTEIGAAYNSLVGLAKGAGKSSTKSMGADFSNMGSDGTTASDQLATAKDVAKRLGTSDVNTIGQIISGKLGMDTPFGGASVAGNVANRADISSAIQAGRMANAKKGFDRQAAVIENFRTSEEFKDVRSSNREATDRIDASLTKGQRFQSGASASFSEAERYNEVMRRSELVSRDTSYNYDKDFNNWLDRKGLLGTGDRKVLVQEAQSFLMSGEVDLVNGKDRFMPQNGGGANIMQPVSDSLSGITPNSLRSQYDAAKPNGGEAGVMSADSRNQAQVLAAQKAQGLNANAMVGDGGLRAAVTAKNAAVRSTISTTGEAVKALSGQLGQDYIERSGNIQPDTKAGKEVWAKRADSANLNIPGSPPVPPSSPVEFPPGYVPGSGADLIPKK
jgi:conjugal transfer mating pair stabilization protein TraG